MTAAAEQGAVQAAGDPADLRARARPTVVGIGASAGGLDALLRFFERVPRGHGVAFVVVAHHAPPGTSLLRDLLARRTPLDVVEIAGDDELRADHVYLAPSRGYVRVTGDRLQASDVGPPHRPIDALFGSLADDRGDRSIGIILSGTGVDGTRGVMDIRAADGLVLVQAPDSAKHPGMPESAIASRAADAVLSPEELAPRLLAYLRRPPLAEARRTVAEWASDLEATRAILAAVRSRTGHDLTSYKPSVVRRRLEHRMIARNAATVGDYAALLSGDAAEVDALFRQLLVRVTSFFRDPAAFDALSVELERYLRRQPEREVRAWVAGCATGEEAYSIAILLSETRARLGRAAPIRVFATDLDESAIAWARAGRYPEASLGQMDPARVHRHFVKVGGDYQVDAALRAMVTFAPQNLLGDAPFARLDLVACRNVLIYLDAEAQRQLLTMFHRCLRPDGLLFLGMTESLGMCGRLFQPLDARRRIFRGRDGQEAPMVPAPPAGIASSSTWAAPPETRALAPAQVTAAETTPRGPISRTEREAALDEAEERWRAVVHDLEISNQELRSLNQELQATNQELRSRIEELEAARGDESVTP